MTQLEKRRIVAHCLNALLTQQTLGMKAHKFDPEHQEDWSVCENDIIAIIDQREVASCHIMGDQLLVVIPRWQDLIRTEHLSDFNPAEHGLEADDGYNPATGEEFNDDEIMVSIPSSIPGMDLPEHPMPRRPTQRPIRVIASR